MDRRTWLFAACGLAGGCMTPGDPMIRESGGRLRQSGSVEVMQTADGIEVAYPKAFGAVPTLVLGDGKGSIPASEVEVLDQQPDHFRIRWKRDGGLAPLSWRAEGPPPAVAPGGR